MQRSFRVLGLVVSLLGWVISTAPGPAAEPGMQGTPSATAVNWHYLNASSVDPAHLLPAPPAAGSLAAQADLETVLAVQAARTPDQIAWAKMIEQDDVFKSFGNLGGWFTAENLPAIAAFFKQIGEDAAGASRSAKGLFSRPRPFVVDLRVMPCVDKPTTDSYPSGHSSRAWLWATILSEIFPERRTELMDRARAVAWGRVIGGVHFPTDLIGGKLMGEEIGAEILKNPKARAAVEKCRAEAQPFLLKKAA